ncbi:MAG: fibronectin type III domain-containing protein [Phycisphaerales bacterium]
MPTYPRERIQFLQWCEAHWPVWVKSPTSIGLTPGQVTAFQQLTQEFRAAVTAQTTAKDAFKAATEAVKDDESATREEASALVRAIRAYAVNTNNPEVYQVAQIPAPQPPGVVPPPGQPTDFGIGLNSDGSITIRWKATHPEGSFNVVYFVQRKLVGEDAFTLIGGTGEREFTDTTLPVGIDGATYIFTAQRGQVQGQPSRQLTVTFGSGGLGRGARANLTLTEGASPKKLAA